MFYEICEVTSRHAPQILVNNQDTWTNCLLSAVASYGGYSKIPEAEKKSLLAHYKHKDIQEVLFESSHHKCAFCECKPGESSNIEVEHDQQSDKIHSL